MSQPETARRLGVSLRTLRGWELGEVPPNLGCLDPVRRDYLSIKCWRIQDGFLRQSTTALT